jgi:beta-galactosidase
VACVYDGAAAIVYVNGVEQARVATTRNMVPNPSYNFKLGQGYKSQRYFTGKVDDARVYNRALSADDVAALYAVTAPA